MRLREYRNAVNRRILLLEAVDLDERGIVVNAGAHGVAVRITDVLPRCLCSRQRCQLVGARDFANLVKVHVGRDPVVIPGAVKYADEVEAVVFARKHILPDSGKIALKVAELVVAVAVGGLDVENKAGQNVVVVNIRRRRRVVDDPTVADLKVAAHDVDDLGQALVDKINGGVISVDGRARLGGGRRRRFRNSRRRGSRRCSGGLCRCLYLRLRSRDGGGTVYLVCRRSGNGGDIRNRRRRRLVGIVGRHKHIAVELTELRELGVGVALHQLRIDDHQADARQFHGDLTVGGSDGDFVDLFAVAVNAEVDGKGVGGVDGIGVLILPFGAVQNCIADQLVDLLGVFRTVKVEGARLLRLTGHDQQN